MHKDAEALRKNSRKAVNMEHGLALVLIMSYFHVRATGEDLMV